MSKLPTSIAELPEPSEYLQDVLATPPRWIIRWGETFVCLLVVFLLALGWLIRYPDRIPAEAVITTLEPPVPVIARANGALMQLMVEDQDTVVKGQMLAVVQNSAHFSDIMLLKKELRAFSLPLIEVDTFFTQAYQLGELQLSYTKLQEASQEYQLYQRLTPDFRARQAVSKQLRRYQDLLVQQQNQEQLLNQKVHLATKDYQRNQKLHQSQTIADKTLEASEAQWLESQENHQKLRSELSHTKVQMADLEREWLKFNMQHTQKETQLHTELATAIDNLRSALAQWEDKYLLVAPYSGLISFSEFWSERQTVQTGQTVVNIIPAIDKQTIVGQLHVPIRNSGKLAIGQMVEVSLANYPREEFGIIRGTVKSISSLPKQGKYHLTVTFPNGLMTQYGREIPFQQQLQGTAEIVTKNLRLVERLFYQMRRHWKK